ncbi:ATP-binding cassette domain-containing protein [Spongisporangium articulatum]|uniref:ATP-binding cassette domain-containing protein n=1 Tax=Spongisporangium articulatum TaxID=3362603 RepID=A0ABW8AV08_9ACTN
MIELHGVTKRHGTVVAAHEVTFAAHPGQVTAVVGPNGSGTSTVLRLAAGRLEPDAGRVRVTGAVGALLDGRAAPTGTTVRAVLEARAAALGVSHCQVDDVLAAVGLLTCDERRVEDLSPGAHGLVGLAAALLGDPPLLVLDQPTTGLDLEGADRVRRLLVHRARAGRTVLVAAHDPADVVPPADRLVVLRAGRVVADRPTGDPSSPPPVRVRTPDLPRLASLFDAEQVRFAEPDLVISGHAPETIAQLAAAYGIPLYELTPLRSAV